MTAADTAPPSRRARRGRLRSPLRPRGESGGLVPGGNPVDVRSDSPIEPAGAMPIAEQVIPAHLLDGGEIVLFAIKPSLWFILLCSIRWIVASVLLWLAASYANGSRLSLPLMQLAVVLLVGRLAWATMQWSTRLYILTNRRIMRIRGVFSVNVFECPLSRIQNTVLHVSLAERIVRIGSILASTAAGDATGHVSWRMVARPLEIHERLRQAIDRAQRKNHNGL